MARLPNTSPQTLLVLAALLEAPAAWHYGYALSRRTGLRSGTLYPLLMRLAEQGWLETRWVEAERPGRPPRHTYRLTTEGARAAAAQLAAADAKRTQAAQQPRPGIEGAGA
jgi:PadR family transcriptional regulator, regulatory protein PadR